MNKILIAIPLIVVTAISSSIMLLTNQAPAHPIAMLGLTT